MLLFNVTASEFRVVLTPKKQPTNLADCNPLAKFQIQTSY